MNKICKSCNLSKPLSDFSKKKLNYTSRCKICNNQYFKTWYEKNKKKQYSRVRKDKARRTAEVKQYLIEYLQTHPCVHCNNDNILVLEFDHLYDKVHNISSMIQKSKSLESVKKELEKCQVLCANCHKIKTHYEQNTYRTRLKKL